MTPNKFFSVDDDQEIPFMEEKQPIIDDEFQVLKSLKFEGLEGEFLLARAEKTLECDICDEEIEEDETFIAVFSSHEGESDKIKLYKLHSSDMNETYKEELNAKIAEEL